VGPIQSIGSPPILCHNQSVRKYWEYFVQNINEYLAYRLRLFLSLASNLIVPITMIWIFSSLPQSQIAGMTKLEIVRYYVLGSFFYSFTNAKVDEFVKTSIQHGELGRYLIKPVNFWILAFINDFSLRFIRLLISLPIIFIFAMIVGLPLNFLKTIISPTVAIVLVLSYLLSFLFSFSLGLLTFWVEEVWGLQNLKDTAIKILSGLAIPYQFFPIAVVALLKWLPFPYLVIWPLRIGFTGNFLTEVLIACVWVVIFYLLGVWLWRRGLNIYGATGLY